MAFCHRRTEEVNQHPWLKVKKVLKTTTHSAWQNSTTHRNKTHLQKTRLEFHLTPTQSFIFQRFPHQEFGDQNQHATQNHHDLCGMMLFHLLELPSCQKIMPLGSEPRRSNAPLESTLSESQKVPGLTDIEEARARRHLIGVLAEVESRCGTACGIVPCTCDPPPK